MEEENHELSSLCQARIGEHFTCKTGHIRAKKKKMMQHSGKHTSVPIFFKRVAAIVFKMNKYFLKNNYVDLYYLWVYTTYKSFCYC